MLLLAFVLGFHLTPESPTVDYRQPQMAALHDTVVVTFGARNTIYFSVSHDRGRRFSQPVKVAEEGQLSLGMHRGPRIAITPRAIVVSAIVGEKGKGADGDVLAWRSTDGGLTWSRGAAVNDVSGAAREGLHAMAASPNGPLFAVWLDLRRKGTRLYGAFSQDDGATWSKNVLVYESPDGSICECCHPSAAMDGRGNVAVTWRNQLRGARDMYVIQSSDGGRTFGDAEKLGGGTWPLKACPMDGGGVSVSPQGKIVSAWRREDEVFVAPAGGAEMLLDEGRNPAIAATADGVFVAWSSPAGIRVRMPGRSDPALLDNQGGYVQLAPLADGSVIAAWEYKGSIRFQVVR